MVAFSPMDMGDVMIDNRGAHTPVSVASKHRPLLWLVAAAALILMAGCAPATPSPTATLPPTVTSSPTIAPSATSTGTPTPRPTPTLIPTPIGGGSRLLFYGRLKPD